MPPLIPWLNRLKWVLGTVFPTREHGQKLQSCQDQVVIAGKRKGWGKKMKWLLLQSDLLLNHCKAQREILTKSEQSMIWESIQAPFFSLFWGLCQESFWFCVFIFGCSIFFHWSQFLEAVDKMIFYLFPLLTLSMSSHPKSWDGIPSTACSSGCSFGMSFCNRSSSFTSVVCLAGQQWEVCTAGKYCRGFEVFQGKLIHISLKTNAFCALSRQLGD